MFFHFDTIFNIPSLQPAAEPEPAKNETAPEEPAASLETSEPEVNGDAAPASEAPAPAPEAEADQPAETPAPEEPSEPSKEAAAEAKEADESPVAAVAAVTSETWRGRPRELD